MRNSSSPRAGAMRRLEVSIELTLDASLSATARIILGALIVDEPGPVVTPTDRELADRHGVSERTARNALASGERAGWIRRGTWGELLAHFPDLAARVPRVCRPRRFIVLLWLHRGREPATPGRKPAASKPAPSGNPDPEPPAPDCRPLACARSACSELRTIEREERTFVLPPSVGSNPALAAGFARMMAEASERESTPGFVPLPDVWEPPKCKPTPTARMKVEDMVAACVGPDQVAALDALLLWLATELRDAKPLTRSFWARTIPAILSSADGFDELVELIVAARRKRFPARWFSACMARGGPSAQKPIPGASRQTSPGIGPRFKSVGATAPEYKYTRRVNP